MTEQNPYQPPSELSVAPLPTTDSRATHTFVLWTVLFVVNLPLPVLFGATVTRGPARWGMVLIVAGVYAFGLLFCLNNPKRSKSLLAGSTMLALSQFVPVIHILAGLSAISVVSKSGMISFDPEFVMGPTDSLAAGAALTVITSGMLAVIAMLTGIVWMTILNHVRPHSPAWAGKDQPRT